MHTRYIVQSLEQMHDAIPLTTANPPLQAPVFLPACSVAGDGYPCEWTRFRRTVGTAAGIARP
jgi:4-phytase/acid phosphatase